MRGIPDTATSVGKAVCRLSKMLMEIYESCEACESGVSDEEYSCGSKSRSAGPVVNCQVKLSGAGDKTVLFVFMLQYK
jgi:hypothetical protein